MNLRNACFSIFTVAILCAWSPPIFAEEIRVYGVPLEVDSIEHLDDDSVKLTIDNHSRIIAPEQVQVVVLSEAEKKGALHKLKVSALLGMLESAITVRHTESIIRLLLTALTNNEVTSDEIERAIRAVKLGEGGSELLESFWAEHAAELNVKTQALVLLTMVEDGNSSVSALTPGSELEQIVWGLGEDRMLNLLEQGESCRTLQKALTLAFGVTSERATRVKEACDFGLSALEAENSLDINALQKIYAVANKDDFARSIVEPTLVRALHKKSSEYLNLKQYDEAVSVLGDVPLHKISPTTQEILVDALSKISDILSLSNTNDRIHDFLKYNAERNPNIKVKYVEAIIRSLIKTSKAKDWDTVERGLALLGIIGAPSDKRDSVRTDIAFSAISLDEIDRARKYFDSRESAPSLFLKLKFFMFGGYGGRWIALLAFVLITYKISQLLRSQRRARIQSFEKMIKSASMIHTEDDQSSLSEEETRELNRNLIKLGLDTKASVGDVKSAFREIVKKIHPDLNQAVGDISAGDKNTSEFVELTKAYDRALMLMQKRSEV